MNPFVCGRCAEKPKFASVEDINGHYQNVHRKRKNEEPEPEAAPAAATLATASAVTAMTADVVKSVLGPSDQPSFGTITDKKWLIKQARTQYINA